MNTNCNRWLPALAIFGICSMAIKPEVAAAAAAATTNTITPSAASPTYGAPAAKPSPPPSSSAKLSAAELEKLAMPIALHPDPLIATILTASVYPLEIVQAARFVKDTNNIPKVDQQSWDDNVKRIAKIPALINRMDQDLDWTVQLGGAFVDQPMDLMNAIQALRAKAQKAGTLKTSPQQIVTTTNAAMERMYQGQVVYVTNTIIQVQPANSQVVYVPSYPSTVYVEDDDDDDEAAAAVISFGVGMAFGAAIWGNCDYHYGGCYWGGYPPYPPPYPPAYYPPPGSRPPPPANRPPGERPDRPDRPGNRPGDRPGSDRPGAGGPRASQLPAQRWQPDQSRLNRSGAATVANREARGWGGSASTRPSASTGLSGTRPSTGTARPSTGAARPSYGTPSATQPRAPSAYDRSPSSSPSSRGQTSSSFDRSASGSRGSAFGGMDSGASSRSFSNRGATSRSGGFGGGGGRRGGGGRGR